ncbi:hypothetical protein Taro_018872 [Colocasia esculenta]|uniref:Uncharacterized protein n=1 Tax=Colocasia esculenta TaxID=4460 RepID=A0A843UJQ3_COLES|nr:hypothetical protein [Colocasia esculenta]
MTPVSNPDNTTQEQPPSLAVTDVRVRLNGCQLEHTRSPEYSLNRLPRTGVPGNGNNLSHGTSPQVPRTGRTTSPELPKVRHWKTGLAGDQYVYWCP